MTECCNDFGQCTRGKNCPARAASDPPFLFCTHEDKSPQAETASDTFYFIGFALVVAVIFGAANLVWAALSHFYPSTACMLQELFSITCK
jgi:hypothetical protein